MDAFQDVSGTAAVRVARGQRDRVFRKHHGYVRIKRCGFCDRGSHLDELGISAPPWRFPLGGAPPRLTWYCCVQCAKHLDCRQAGWWRLAPRLADYDEWAFEGAMPSVPREDELFSGRLDWAEDEVTDPAPAIKFGSF